MGQGGVHRSSGVVGIQLLILLWMDDTINRQLTVPITEEDSSLSLADELIYYGFISSTLQWYMHQNSL